MPLYEYECEACGRRFEVIQKFSDPAVDVCAQCGKGPVRRLLSSPAIQFKGSGWYVTDYAKKQKDSSSETKSDTGAEKKSTDSAAKTDSGTSSPSPPPSSTSKE